MININSNNSQDLMLLTKMHVGIDRAVLHALSLRLSKKHPFKDLDEFHTWLIREQGKSHFTNKSRKEWQTLSESIEVGELDYSQGNYNLYQHEYGISLDEFLALSTDTSLPKSSVNKKKCIIFIVIKNGIAYYTLTDGDGDALYIKIVTDPDLQKEYDVRFEKGKEIVIVKMKELMKGKGKGNPLPPLSLLEEVKEGEKDGVEKWAMAFAEAFADTFHAIAMNLVGRFASFNARLHLWNKKRIEIFARGLGYTYIQFLSRLFLYMQYGVDVFKYEKALNAKNVMEEFAEWLEKLKEAGVETHPSQWVKNQDGSIADGILSETSYILSKLPESESGYVATLVQNAFRRTTEESYPSAMERYNEFIHLYEGIECPEPKVGDYEVYPEIEMFDELPSWVVKYLSPVSSRDSTELSKAVSSKLKELAENQYTAFQQDMFVNDRDKSSVTKVQRIEAFRAFERNKLNRWIASSMQEWSSIYSFQSGRELTFEEVVSYFFLEELFKQKGSKRLTITFFFGWLMKWFVNAKKVKGIYTHINHENQILNLHIQPKTEVMYGLRAMWGGKEYKSRFEKFWNHYCTSGMIKIELVPVRTIVDSKISQVTALCLPTFHGFQTDEFHVNDEYKQYIDGRIFGYMKAFGYEGVYNCLFKQLGNTYYITVFPE